ncbi:MAG: dihydroneopterin aldolase [Candidatus Cryptobacteroides sp.]|nr:dihydroneopterin aldolase [Candidatus Cryptobacteroides sp.]MEE3429395.1 dihydroneopterin aldolase [Candidatus Cryptobacteroides sp.]
MDKEGKIELIGMEFHAFHGCLPEERTNGNTFVVDFVGYIDMKKAFNSDDLKDTVDVNEVYEVIAKEMATPSNLLENVCGRIVKAIEKSFNFWPFSVTVSKKNPPLEGPCEWSKITMGEGLQEGPEIFNRF